jgi:hypothetical protein
MNRALVCKRWDLFEVMECVCAPLGMWIDQEIEAKIEDESCTCLRVLNQCVIGSSQISNQISTGTLQ